MNPYFIDEPAAISFSGGRTSAFMLYKILEAHNWKLPDYVKVTFANTGKEMPQTLDFVQQCSDEWGVEIAWLELIKLTAVRQDNGKNKIIKEYKVTDYKNASRHGEPFDALLEGMDAISNVVHRTCTAYMKMRAIQWYCDNYFGGNDYIKAIGIRADEQRRAVKIRNQIKEGAMCICPCYDGGATAAGVGDFWNNQHFDLQLPNNNGVTDWGNCDLCFLKAKNKRISIIRERPDLATWWINAEHRKKQKFRPDEIDYKMMKHIALNQFDMFKDIDDESIPCFCGD